MNELARLEEFQAILGNKNQKYLPSKDSQQIIKNASIALFVGPTNAGRNTIISKLLPTGKYYFVVSDTTRPPKMRNGELEKDGVNYWFRTEAEILDDLKAGAFVEAAVIHEQQVSGMSVREIAMAYQQHKTAVTDIEIVGADSVKKINPDAICLFVLPPSFEKWQERLKNRGDLSNNKTELCKRLRSSVKEFQAALEHPHYWFVINDNLEEATSYVDQILTSKKVDPAKQKAGRLLVEELLKKTNDYLENQAWLK